MKKEITIDGKESDWFEQVTFIIKEQHTSEIPKDLVTYAEDLVEKYLKKFPQASMKEVQKVSRLKSHEETVYAIQKGYAYINKQDIKLKKREKFIDIFFYLSVAICIMTVLILLVSIL